MAETKKRNKETFLETRVNNIFNVLVIIFIHIEFNTIIRNKLNVLEIQIKNKRDNEILFN